MEITQFDLEKVVPATFENMLLKLLNVDILNTPFKQSCITLFGKVQSESALRMRKLEKAQLVGSETSFKLSSLLASISNTTAFDLR